MRGTEERHLGPQQSDAGRTHPYRELRLGRTGHVGEHRHRLAVSCGQIGRTGGGQPDPPGRQGGGIVGGPLPLRVVRVDHDPARPGIQQDLRILGEVEDRRVDAEENRNPQRPRHDPDVRRGTADHRHRAGHRLGARGADRPR